MSETTFFGFDNKDMRSEVQDRFKMEMGKTYIISFATEDPNSVFVGCKMHYSKSLKQGWKCLSTSTSKEICCTQDYDGNEAKPRIGCVIVIYSDDEDELTGKTTRKVKSVKPWIFGGSVYDNLIKIYKIHGMVDLQVTCKDATYQTIGSLVPEKAQAWTTNENLKASILAKAKKLYSTLPKMLAPTKSISEIKEILGISSGSAEASTGLTLDSVAGNL
jgi:hypothetical protein